MPIYEYRCQACGASFDLLRRMSDTDTGVLCPQCASEQVERQLSCFATSAAGCGPGGGGAGRFR